MDAASHGFSFECLYGRTETKKLLSFCKRANMSFEKGTQLQMPQ